MNIALRALTKGTFFLCALVSIAFVLLVDAPYALLTLIITKVFALWAITTYHCFNPRYQATSTSQNRKLILFTLIATAAFFMSVFTAKSYQPLQLLTVWVWLSLISFFYADTFRSALTYFGRHKPLVKDVRSHYHLALFLLHFAIGAFLSAGSQLAGATIAAAWLVGKISLAITFAGLSVGLLLGFVIAWSAYRKAHAEGERYAIHAYGEDFTKQYQKVHYSALSEEERKLHA